MHIGKRTPARRQRRAADEHERAIRQPARDVDEKLGVEGVRIDATDETHPWPGDRGHVCGQLHLATTRRGEGRDVGPMRQQQAAPDVAPLLGLEMRRAIDDEIGTGLQRLDLCEYPRPVGLGKGFEPVCALHDHGSGGNALDQIGPGRAVHP